MSDELRAAAERLRNHWDGEESCHADEITLAKAWLAEHPADDDLPVDEEWLQSIGFVRIEEWQAWIPGDWCDQCVLFHRSVDAPCAWLMQYETDFYWPHDLHTRLDVRLLCKTLRIPLNEKAPS